MEYHLNIERIAKRKGLSIEKLLKIASINNSSYYHMKRNNKFSTETLEKLAKALNVSVADLVRDKNEKEIENADEALKDFDEIRKKLDDFEDKHLK